MDHAEFDDLTRSASSGGTRRAVLRVLAVGALAVVVRGLGRDGVGAKEKGPKRKRRADQRAQDAVRGEGKRKGHKRKKRKPRDKKPTPPRACGELPTTLCGACEEPICVAGAWACKAIGDTDCGGGVCAWADECCPGQHRCADGKCLPEGQCCPEQHQCSYGGPCVAGDQCCPGEKRCADRDSPNGWACVDESDCCPGEKRCGDECIRATACCADDPYPLCDPCQEVFCVNGTYVCSTATAGVDACQQCPEGTASCPSVPSDWFGLPQGCCPQDHYFADPWYGSGRFLCAEPRSGGTGVWCD